MGLAASQARLLSLTARIHDVEYQAQMIQSAKLKLALNEDAALQKYNDALDAEQLIFKTDSGKTVAANYENLFGKASIKNGMNTSYMLYDKYDHLIIPDEIYDEYLELAGDAYTCLDPQMFAMHMTTGAPIKDINEAEKSLFDEKGNSKYNMSKTLTSLSEQRNKLLGEIGAIIKLPESLGGNVSFDEGAGAIGSSTADIISSIKNAYNPENGTQSQLSEEEYKNLCKLLDEFGTVNDKYKYLLYNNMAETICENLPNGGEDFDYDTYNYYLRYAKMIQEEGGLIGTSPANRDGGENFSSDAELLNEMIKSGSLWLDIVGIDRTNGNVTYSPTSTSTDSSVTFVNASSVDSTALKKAEAEYNQAMKKIDRQDKQYDLELNRLETERSALTTEYESVKTVIKDNIERTFGIFS